MSTAPSSTMAPTASLVREPAAGGEEGTSASTAGGAPPPDGAAASNINGSTTAQTNRTYAPERHQHQHQHAPAAENEIKLHRMRMGRCADCNMRTDEVDPSTGRLTPLTNANVLDGRCLLCHPLPSVQPAAGVAAPSSSATSGTAAAAAPQPDALAQAPAPPAKRIKMEHVKEEDAEETDEEAFDQNSAPFEAEAASGREDRIQQPDNQAKALAPARDSHVTPSPPPGEAAISRGLQALVQPSPAIRQAPLTVPASVAAGRLPALTTPAEDSGASASAAPFAEAPEAPSPPASNSEAPPTVDSEARPTEVTAVEAPGTQPRKKRFCDNGYWGEYVGKLNAEGRRHGKGKMTWDDGEWYEGQWKNNKREGWGIQYLDGDVYEGQWKNGKREGKGTYQWADGDKYVGGFKGNKFNGRGTFYYKDGEVDIGNYKDDKFVGEGVRWSKSRKTAWLFQDEEKKRKISTEKAEEMATQLGFNGVPPAMED